MVPLKITSTVTNVAECLLHAEDTATGAGEIWFIWSRNLAVDCIFATARYVMNTTAADVISLQLRLKHRRSNWFASE